MSKITIQHASITDMKTDAIVNAANTHLHQGNGVCGAIFNAAGPEALAKECDAIGHCDVGDAKITSACALKEKNGNLYIIHAVGPKYVDGSHGEGGKLSSCYYHSLELAVKHGCRSIAFPLLSAGIYGYPKDKAWGIGLHACSMFIDDNPDVDIEIVFVGKDEDVLQIGRNILEQIEQDKAEAEAKAAAAQKTLAEKEPKYIFFWKDDEENGEFSNWYKSPFTLEGIQYSCVEQYMMSHKALLFKDYPIYDQIMATSSRHQMKALGRQVHNYDTTVWGACREEVVYNACKAKFLQNDKLMIKLMDTYGRNLAEASPMDKVWGIGLDAQKAAITDPADWPGQNLLGKTLVRVRNENALNYLNFAIDTVKFMTDSQEKLDWCNDGLLYCEDKKPWPEMETAYWSLFNRTYGDSFVVFGYGDVVRQITRNARAEAEKGNFTSLTDNQLLMLFTEHIRADHLCDDYIIGDFIPSGNMLRMLEELKKRTLLQMQTE